MVREQCRCRSFSLGPRFTSSVSPSKLAEAGFFYLPSADASDAVECAFCAVQLESWDSGGDPWSEHRSHTESKGVKCSFVALGKLEKNITAGEFRELLLVRFDLISVRITLFFQFTTCVTGILVITHLLLKFCGS
uniref:Uncharacterized protein n=1 Tax=Trichuris muris TaxID=70415 RepID=A0A5S6Q0P4_TRIMR